MPDIDPEGPLFLSYRQSDGRALAVDLAWALRTAGVPVWQDATDLPPGDTEDELDHALAEGISAGLILLTPEVTRSTVVRTVEAPRLIEAAAQPLFTLAMATTIYKNPAKPGDGYDHAAADGLLGQPSGTASRFKQGPIASPGERAQLAADLARGRLNALAARIRSAGHLRLDVETRIQPAAAASTADLVMRIRPAASGRLPSPAGLRDLRQALAHLPSLVHNALSATSAGRVVVTGGAHLSIAAALGAALPRTLVGTLELVDRTSTSWTDSGEAPNPELIVRHGHGTNTGRTVLAYVDLLPSSSDPAYTALIEVLRPELAAWSHLRSAYAPAELDARQAAPLAAAIAEHIRALAGAHHSTHVHLVLRCPYAIAALVARRLNTLTLDVYEWDDEPTPIYRRALTLAPGRAEGAITDVYLTAVAPARTPRRLLLVRKLLRRRRH